VINKKPPNPAYEVVVDKNLPTLLKKGGQTAAVRSYSLFLRAGVIFQIKSAVLTFQNNVFHSIIR
jgi:hypothetical protein